MAGLRRHLERLNLPVKLAGGFAVLLLLIGLLGGQALVTQDDLRDETRALYEYDVLGVARTGSAVAQMNVAGRALRSLVLAATPEERERARQQLEAARTAVHLNLNEARTTVFRDENLNRLAEVDLLLERANSNTDRIISLLSPPGEPQPQAVALLKDKEVRQIAERVDLLLEGISRSKQEASQQAAERALATFRQGRDLNLALLVGALVLGPLVGLLISLSIRQPVHRLCQTLESLAEGQLDAEVPCTDYPNEVGTLARSVEVLRREAQALADERWVRGQLADFAATLQPARTYEAAGQRLLEGLSTSLPIEHGVLYLHEREERQLRLLAGPGRPCVPLGQGLVGQCAAEAAPIRLTQPPTDYLKAQLYCVATFPVRHDESVLAVLELGVQRPFTPREANLLDELLALLAMTLALLQREVETENLLGETQAQAQRMEVQAARLEEQAVELEAQQAELRQTESWYRSIIEAAPDGLLVANHQGAVVLANPQAESLFGRDLTGRALDRLLEAQAGRHFEVGRSQLPALDGRSVSTCVSVRDVTERTEMEERMRRAHFLADTALELTRCGYWRAVAGESCYRSSERTVAIAGEPIRPDLRYDLAEWLERIGEVDPTCAERTSALFQAALAGETPRYDALFPYRRPKDGRVVWLHAIGHLVGEGVMHGVIQDVTERQLVAERLQASEQQVRFMLESSPVAVRVSHAETMKALLLNQSYADLLEGTREELAATDCRTLYRTPGQYDELMRGVSGGDSLINVPVALRTLKGNAIWVLASYIPVVYQDAPGLLSWLFDITDLRRARSAAEDATRMKSDFLANMSHEIRTPMNAIIGLSHLTLKTELTARQRDYVQKIQQAGQHLLGIIDDILDFSKLEAGQLTLEQADFEVQAVLRDVLGRVADRAATKGLELALQVDPEVPTHVRGDSLRVSQILVHYANNALQFTERGEVVVGVKFRSATASEVQLEFFVRDSGLGLTQAQSERILQSFPKTSGKTGGTGLGLAISKQLAQLMRGESGVESRPGHGSTFWFTAWLASSEAPPVRRSR